MTTQNSCAVAPVVSIVHNAVTALSTDVARSFGKLHKNVLRDIRSLIEQAPQLNGLNFEPVDLVDAKGEKRPAYRMDRKGFVLLAMGFTGEVALKFKIAYIDTFDHMEEQLRKQKSFAEDSSFISPAQQLGIRNAVARRAQKTPELYRAIYSALKQRFQVARYDQILQADYDSALEFIDDVRLPRLPAISEQQPKAEPAAETTEVYRYELGMSREEIESFGQFIYCWKYLFRPSLVTFRELLSAVHSPLAGNLYDATFDTTLNRLEGVFLKHGIPVGPEHYSRTLPFYP